jgi:hypothetical protein
MKELEVTSSSNIWNSEHRKKNTNISYMKTLKYSEYKENKNTSIKKYQLHRWELRTHEHFSFYLFGDRSLERSLDCTDHLGAWGMMTMRRQDALGVKCYTHSAHGWILRDHKKTLAKLSFLLHTKVLPLAYFMLTLLPLAKAIMVALMLSIRTLVHYTNLYMKRGTLAHFCKVLMKCLMGLWAFLLCWPHVVVHKNLPSIPKS